MTHTIYTTQWRGKVHWKRILNITIYSNMFEYIHPPPIPTPQKKAIAAGITDRLSFSFHLKGKDKDLHMKTLGEKTVKVNIKQNIGNKTTMRTQEKNKYNTTVCGIGEHR